jgi:hypothetical protein
MTLEDHSPEAARYALSDANRFVIYRRRLSIFHIISAAILLVGAALMSFAAGERPYGLLVLAVTAAGVVYEVMIRRFPYVSIGDGAVVVRKAFFHQKSIDARLLIGVIESGWGKLDIVYGDGSKVVVSLDQMERQDQEMLVSEVKRLARLAPSNSGIEHSAAG